MQAAGRVEHALGLAQPPGQLDHDGLGDARPLGDRLAPHRDRVERRLPADSAARRRVEVALEQFGVIRPGQIDRDHVVLLLLARHRAVAHAPDVAGRGHQPLGVQEAGRQLEVVPGVRMVTATRRCSIPGASTRISIGSSVASASAVRLRPSPSSTAVRRMRVTLPGRATRSSETLTPAVYDRRASGDPRGRCSSAGAVVAIQPSPVAARAQREPGDHPLAALVVAVEDVDRERRASCDRIGGRAEVVALGLAERALPEADVADRHVQVAREPAEVVERRRVAARLKLRGRTASRAAPPSRCRHCAPRWSGRPPRRTPRRCRRRPAPSPSGHRRSPPSGADPPGATASEAAAGRP